MISLLLAALVAGQTPADAPAIRLNQTGFETDGPKVATLATPSGQPLDWQLVDASGQVLARGRTRPFGPDAASGERVHIIDMGEVRTPGTDLRLQAGGHASHPFDITARPFARLKVDALSYFYQNRAGVPILAAHVERPDLARAAGHPQEIATCLSGADLRGMIWAGCDYRLDVTGGWYDAGDHGKYVVNGGIATWTLLNLWERSGNSGRPQPFADGSARMPEAGNGIDDVLDEARYEIEFLLKMQVPDGAMASVPVGRDATRMTRIEAGGMAHHTVHDARWTALPLAPADDREPRLLDPPTTAATLNLAAVAAQCARVWRTIDTGLAERCLAAARRAWTAAEANPDVYRTGGFDGVGPYADSDLSDERFWAAAELFATTGEAQFAAALEQSPYWPGGARAAEATGEPGFAVTAPLGALTLITTGRSPSAQGLEQLKSGLVAQARQYLAESRTQGYGLPLGGTDVYWGSTGALANRAMILAVAHDLTGEAAFRHGVVATLDYLMGRNPMDQSYISGWGERAMQKPHHRFWAYGVDPAWPRPPAGALSGGPNNTNLADPVARTLDGCRPLQCWTDDAGAFSMNEVAINWNAPLVWIAAWIDPDPVPVPREAVSRR
ncbi:glycosyl hydrolase [Rhizobium sp. CRIBSB]|nr:glycosyl hydrolase [Rhizobium sp. CRIBSB]